MKPFPKLALALAAPLLLAFCGESAPHHDAMHGEGDHHSMHNDQAGQTVVRKADGVQAAFDLMDRDAHAKMMQRMGMSMEGRMHESPEHRHAMITLMDLESNSVIRDAKQVQVKVRSPNGMQKSGSHEMSGGSMHHYGVDFEPQGAGTYTVNIAFEYDGKPREFSADFKLP